MVDAKRLALTARCEILPVVRFLQGLESRNAKVFAMVIFLADFVRLYMTARTPLISTS